MSGVPGVGVLMAIRNGAAFLPQTISSLMALREPPDGVQFVVVDDASNDATPQLLSAWAASDPRVCIVTANTAQGLAGALNLGLREIRAPLVARADADDLYHPERLVLQAAAMTADPGLAALSCGYVRIDQTGAEMDRVLPVTGSAVIGFRSLYTSSLLHPGAMIRTAALRKAGGYDTAYWTAQDSDLWARLIADGARLDNLPQPLVHYRIHGGSVMRRRGAAGQALSLTVPGRMQAAYLGGLPPEHDVGATVALWQSYSPLEPERVRAGLHGIARIAAVARRREPPEVLADMRRTLARALWRQARWCGRRDPRLLAQLAGKAARWRSGW